MAVPNPERELQRLDQETKAGIAARTVILGPSDWFRARAFDLVLERVDQKADLRIVDGEQKSEGKELAALRGAGLFAKASVLAVRRAEDWLAAVGDQLLVLAPKIPKGSALVVEAKKLDKRTRLGKLLGEGPGLYEFRDLYAEPWDARSSPLEAELVQWLVQRSRAAGAPLSPEAAWLLVSTVGKDPGELLAEVGRLRHVVGERKGPLTVEDLRGKVNASFQSTPFEFAEAFLLRDRKRCLRALGAMFARGLKDKDGGAIDQGGVFPFVTSWLQQTIGQVLAGRQELDRGTPLAEVSSRVGVRLFQDRFMRQVQVNDRPSLERALGELLRCQRELRSTGEDPQLLLESLVARTLGARS